jgi:hypothetical protein
VFVTAINPSVIFVINTGTYMSGAPKDWLLPMATVHKTMMKVTGSEKYTTLQITAI